MEHSKENNLWGRFETLIDYISFMIYTQMLIENSRLYIFVYSRFTWWNNMEARLVR